jgi:hypothetical protein
MKSNLEIAVAWFDPISNRWQTAQALTMNAYLDRSPKLAGKTKDDVILVLVANPSNHITGR